jgi:ATP/maltotriose-dependent transcriptional regulator MalT
VLTAPPGFGKTTLLAEWVAAERAGPVAWLLLDEDDNDPARFFEYVIATKRSDTPASSGSRESGSGGDMRTRSGSSGPGVSSQP